jgi:hypothetical protein
MIITLHIPDSIPLDTATTKAFTSFLQCVVNRRCVGALCYGDRPRKEQRYMTRLRRELDAYKRKGNYEQLLNIAVYAFLESHAPENAKFHWDDKAESVTRKKLGGNIA